VTWFLEDSDVLRTDKERIVARLAEELSAAETLIVADYRGLTNKQLEALRDELLNHGARFRIVKNTLTRRAAEQAGAESLLVMLEGPTAIAFIETGGDPAAVAKALAATAKQTNVLSLRGGVLEGKTLTGEQVDRLATLPPMDVLRGQLVGAIIAPVTQLLALVSAPLQNLHGLIDARIKQLEEQGEVVEPAAEADTEEAPAAEAAAEPTEAEEAPASEAAEADEPVAEAAVEPTEAEATPAEPAEEGDTAVEEVAAAETPEASAEASAEEPAAEVTIEDEEEEQ
jgi:large subunit ribosomal protein L10